MTAYPAHLIQSHRLFDGRTVTIRPVRPDDAGRAYQFLGRLSGESRYLRFQKWIGMPSDRLAEFLTDVDYDRHMAFICTAPAGDAVEMVGDARYAVNADGASCEFGLMIADDWHNTGIAGLLMEALIGTARSRGLKTMEGLVLAINNTMLRFSRGLGFELTAVPEDLTTMRIVKRL